MSFWKWSTILAVASVSGGLFLTLLSGLYVVKPLVMDAEIVYFGFPLAWLEAGRSTWMPKPPLSWHYFFLWDGFIIDFLIYGLFVTTVMGIYFVSLPKRKKPLA